ncbi:hypothetical protein LCGC14_1030580 [marine sediment metagenome]|uniref:Uncharacterized protein n=1 Tax=marine sediment metagenome TaxID=412755 RepID=A0A0F9MZ92_9ZZZZ
MGIELTMECDECYVRTKCASIDIATLVYKALQAGWTLTGQRNADGWLRCPKCAAAKLDAKEAGDADD